MEKIAQEKQLHRSTLVHVDGQSYKAILFKSCHDPLFTDVGCESIFQQKAYHAVLESAPPGKMTFWYVRLEKEGRLVGMLCFQIKDFNPGDSLKNQINGSIIRAARYRAASLINLSVLCLGNTLVTGDYGFCFQPGVSSRLQTELMMCTIDWMLSLPDFKKIGLVFVKDFYRDIFEDIADSPHCRKYHQIDTQPSMIMDIPSDWGSLDGYLASLKSKYRVRAKKALKMAAHLERIELTADEIEAIEDHLHQLYLKVVEDVGFNLFILSKGYFTKLKRAMGDKFRLWVYKDRGEVISFFTVFEDGDILDAHFLGYDPEVNHHYKLYLNMLLTMIDMAASRGFRQLQLSRTATEIKSSVGAEGVRMWAYMRHPKKSLNWLIPKAYNFFKPDLDWVPRKPFNEA
jgi:hypothetical protein